MDTASGYVEHIVFRNEENGYSVLVISEPGGGEYTLTGILPDIAEGEYLSASGQLVSHPVYGDQLAVASYEVHAPETKTAILKYLSSGAVKGIGEAMAGRIVKKFGSDALRVMEEEPERLAEIKGISEKKAAAISEQVIARRDMRQAMIFLQDYGISLTLAAKIFDHYGTKLYGIIRENPYKLAEDIRGVGFKAADAIAMKAGIGQDSEFRVRSGILYCLENAEGNGHLYLPMRILRSQAAELLRAEPENIEHQIMNLMMDKKLVVRKKKDSREQEAEGETGGEEEYLVYLSSCYYTELNTARMLHDLDDRKEVPEEVFLQKISRIEEDRRMQLDERQRAAVYGAVTHGLFVMTGGPGTGKTTTIRAMLDYFEKEGKSILLAAPTGRAAKRMTETTGREARTIHRLLEVSGREDAGETAVFGRGEDNPLEADVLIVDEMSMVDIFLMNSLLKAVPEGMHLVLVGDVDQLPSVGPGNVLKDIIASGCFAVIRLTRIFRQSDGSDIVMNAHRINRGERIDLAKRSRDFLFIRQPDANTVVNACITLAKEKLPGYVKADPYDIQILTPMRKGNLGVERLNPILQGYFNPPSPEKTEKAFERCTFREGDKVMQVRNNYQMKWEVRGWHGVVSEEGTGVFNGDTGVIREINLFTEELTVEFEEKHTAVYAFKELDDLELAYAVTIHKSQGSEYPAVVIPLLSGPRMLMNRNLLYTAVTRAKSCVCLVGLPEVFYDMADNNIEQRRYSGLSDRLRELKELA